MILCKVIDRLDTVRGLRDMEGIGFVRLELENGSHLTAVDLLGTVSGDQVMICVGEAAQNALGRRCPVDAAVTAVVRQ